MSALDEPTAPDGFHVEWEPEGDDWMFPDRPMKCSQKTCDKQAMMILWRYYWRNGRQHPRRWGCCEDRSHAYGRRIRHGVIESWRWVRDAA